MTAPGLTRRGARGFSLVEALVVLVLLGIVSTVLTGLLVRGSRVHRTHVQGAAMSESTRAALAILPGALRELSAGDGDLAAIDSGAVTFRALGAVYLVCAPPDVASMTVALDASSVYGSGLLDAPDDSVLLFADGSPLSRLDDVWFAAGVASAVSGNSCPGGGPSIAVRVTGIGAGQLAAVRPGAPLRPFRSAELRAYRDGRGDWWLGQRTFQTSSGTWSTTQPVLGPLEGIGPLFMFRDTAGGPARAPQTVARIGIRLPIRSPERVHRTAGTVFLVRAAATEILLRNNPVY